MNSGVKRSKQAWALKPEEIEEQTQRNRQLIKSFNKRHPRQMVNIAYDIHWFFRGDSEKLGRKASGQELAH